MSYGGKGKAGEGNGTDGIAQLGAGMVNLLQEEDKKAVNTRPNLHRVL